MTREEFATLEARALGELGRIRHHATADIVMVVSRDVLEAMQEINITELTDGFIAAYRGYQIAVVDNPEIREMMRPAIHSMEYHDWMQIGDIIVVDDENRLFSLALTEPHPLFVDMGITVNYFTGLTVEDETVRTHNGRAFTTDRTLYMTDARGNTIEIPNITEVTVDTIPEWMPIANLARMEPVTFTGTLTNTLGQIATDIFSGIADPFGCRAGIDISSPKRLHKKKGEEELNAGDTKLIDDFLKGFAHKETLQSAT